MKVEVTRDIDTCRALRRVVFIEEQGVSEADELDDLDNVATHLLASEQGQPLGTARLLRKGEQLKVGRVCVLQQARGKGIGQALMQAALDIGAQDSSLTQCFLSAQSQVIPFYEALGFQLVGAPYMDAGIPHQDMVCPL